MNKQKNTIIGLKTTDGKTIWIETPYDKEEDEKKALSFAVAKALLNKHNNILVMDGDEACEYVEKEENEYLYQNLLDHEGVEAEEYEDNWVWEMWPIHWDILEFNGYKLLFTHFEDLKNHWYLIDSKDYTMTNEINKETIRLDNLLNPILKKY